MLAGNFVRLKFFSLKIFQLKNFQLDCHFKICQFENLSVWEFVVLNARDLGLSALLYLGLHVGDYENVSFFMTLSLVSPYSGVLTSDVHYENVSFNVSFLNFCIKWHIFLYSSFINGHLSAQKQKKNVSFIFLQNMILFHLLVTRHSSLVTHFISPKAEKKCLFYFLQNMILFLLLVTRHSSLVTRHSSLPMIWNATREKNLK